MFSASPYDLGIPSIVMSDYVKVAMICLWISSRQKRTNIMIITAAIKPNAKHHEEVIANADGSVMIYTKSPAVDGRANDAAIKLLAKYYGVSKSRVRLLRGHTSRQKVFEINTTETLTDDELVTVILPMIQ